MDITIKLNTNNAEDIKQLIGLCNQLISDGGKIEEVLIHPIPQEESKVEEPSITLKELQKTLIEVAKKVGAEKIKTLINSYGVEKLSELDPIKYNDVIKSAEDLKNESC